MQLKVITWNIWGGTHLDEVIDFLRIQDADIIALQEVHEYDDGNTAITIAKKLGYDFVVHALEMQMPASFMPASLQREGKIKYGNAILSKQKIVSSKIHDLSPLQKRPIIQADIQIEDTIFHVFSIHLKHTHQAPSDLQNEQVDNLIKICSNKNTIVMGDFNALPDSYPIKKMNAIMQNTEKEQLSPTWSVYRDGCTVCLVDSIQYKLDYIFTSVNIETHSCEVYDSTGSDHLPIAAIIQT